MSIFEEYGDFNVRRHIGAVAVYICDKDTFLMNKLCSFQIVLHIESRQISTLFRHDIFPKVRREYAKTETILFFVYYCLFRGTVLRRLGTIGRFTVILYKGGNFCDFLFAFLHTSLLLKGANSKRKEFSPVGSKFFPLSVDSFSEGRQTNFERVVSLESIFIPHYGT